MTNTKLLAAAGLAALSVGMAGSAHAAGTTAGASIVNTVSVNFQVGSVSQTAQSATNTVTVDRKVVLTMTTAATTTSVAPGASASVTKYTLTNASNDVLDFALAATNQSGGTAQHGGTDVIDVSNFKYYVDAAGGTAGTYDPGVDTEVTFIDELAADTTRTIYVVSDIPIAATNGQVSGIVLTASAELGGTSGTEGSLLTNNTGANTAGVDNVFADTAGATDGASDGKYSVKGDYTVAAAVLSVNKYSTLISDPISGTTNPKAIPGAVIEYCIAVANGAGAATATGLSLSDTLPGSVTYLSSYGIFINGTVSGATCSGGTSGGSYSATPSPTVTGTLSNLAANASGALRFRVTIN